MKTEQEISFETAAMRLAIGPINAPFIKFSRSELAGHVSYFFHISLQNKEEWQNNIFHNSPFAIFHVREIGGKFVVELTAKHYPLPKFRKATVKGADLAGEKINKWLDECRTKIVIVKA